MELNADFSRRAVVHAAQMDWVPSPIAGVDRRMLDRIGEEVARATSIVRYAPGSQFSQHTHGGGEEFLVLDGVFHDEHGEYPAGYYVRNPPTSAHTPGSTPGCTLFVKLWQFDPNDRTEIRLDTQAMQFTPDQRHPGVAVIPLFQDRWEMVRLEQWEPDARIELALPGGMELLVLEGDFVESHEKFRPQSWLRLPCSSTLNAAAGRNGCRVWLKTAHLTHAQSAPAKAQ
jgi:ChrR-like protein with cupin domain